MMLREHVLDQIRLYQPLFFTVMRLKRRYRNLLVNTASQLVVEGYPRSANTYAVAALRTSQPGPLRLAHHTHSVAQMRRAYDIGVPTLLLIRNPVDAILSYVIREQAVDIPLAINRYITFYRYTLPLSEKFVVSDFETTVSKFANVIAALNDRYPLNLSGFDDTPETQQAIKREVERTERHHSGGPVSELKVGRPSEERRKIKRELEAQLAEFSQDIEYANELYQAIKARSCC